MFPGAVKSSSDDTPGWIPWLCAAVVVVLLVIAVIVICVRYRRYKRRRRQENSQVEAGEGATTDGENVPLQKGVLCVRESLYSSRFFVHVIFFSYVL